MQSYALANWDGSQSRAQLQSTTQSHSSQGVSVAAIVNGMPENPNSVGESHSQARCRVVLAKPLIIFSVTCSQPHSSFQGGLEHSVAHQNAAQMHAPVTTGLGFTSISSPQVAAREVVNEEDDMDAMDVDQILVSQLIFLNDLLVLTSVVLL